MRNARTAVVAVLAAGTAMVWPLGWAPSGASSEAPSHPAEPAVVRANAQVDDALEALRSADRRGPVTVVRVTGTHLQELLRDHGFVGNVHALQDHLNNHDAGPLVGLDVAIADLLAVDFRPDGAIVVFTR